MNRFRPSHGTVVAYLALFVALSGTAVALKAGSVGPRAIRNSAVRTSKIANAAVTAPKLAAGSVTASAIGPGAIGTAQLADGSVIGSKIAAAAVDSQQIADGAVGGRTLKANSVSTNKIDDNAVTGQQVLDGSLTLADVATQVSTTSVSPGNIAGGGCIAQTGIPVTGYNGTQAGQTIAVFPGTTVWPAGFVLDAYGPTGFTASQIGVRVCNTNAGAADPGTLPLTVLIYR
jgi:hypothetical protein